MPLITLTSDWNNGDFYLAALKGRLAKVDAVTVIDISHSVSHFNIGQASFLVENSFSHFPEGSIHLIMVRCELDNENCLLAAKYQGHYFISTDNGLFGLLFRESPEMVVKVDLHQSDEQDSFPELTIFADVAIAIASGRAIYELGTRISNYRQHIALKPSWDSQEIIGNIQYIDSYQNGISNINKKLFEELRAGREFTIFVNSNHDRIEKISNYYSDNRIGDLLAIFNSLGLLEVAVYNGKAAELLNLEVNNNIRIKFYDEHNEG
jgi:S-adenosyl-L-methionine hydrolase (adenosine-forming)